MKTRLLTFLFLAVVLPLIRSTVAAADSHSVRAILVLASNQKGGSDGRLAAYEPTLKRILRFESYKLVGEGSASVGAGGGSVNLGQGHVIALEGDSADGKGKGKGGGGGIRLKVDWKVNGRSAIDTGLVLRPGVPAVLGGPPSGGGGDTWAVILVAG